MTKRPLVTSRRRSTSVGSSAEATSSDKMLPFSLCLLLVADIVYSDKRVPSMPAGTYMTSPNEFIGGSQASNAPACREQEPCGFYTFDGVTRRPQKWIPSWCNCGERQECVYYGYNNRLKIYIHHCAELGTVTVDE